jgi:hypothetical protein
LALATFRRLFELFVHMTYLFISNCHRNRICGMSLISSAPGEKRQRHETDHSHPSSGGVKNAWRFTSIPPCTFLSWCLSIGTTSSSCHLHQNCSRNMSYLCKLFLGIIYGLGVSKPLRFGSWFYVLVLVQVWDKLEQGAQQIRLLSCLLKMEVEPTHETLLFLKHLDDV